MGKADLKEELSKCLPVWGWSGSVDEFLAYWFGSETDMDEALLGHIQTVRARGVRCYLYTNNEKYRIEYIWNALGLKNSFDGIFSSAEIGWRKSQREFWEAVYERLGKPEKRGIIAWDDDKEDLKAAESFGFQSELYTSFDSYVNRMKSP